MSNKFLTEEIKMSRPDVEFWMQLAQLQILNKKLGEHLIYTDQEKTPLDLNYPTDQSEIEAFKHFATTLEDKALEFSAIAETNTTYTAMMEETLSERENELLPSEGDRVGAQVGE